MGRGRQKAKQTKVARDLKYHSETIDVTALQRELASEPGHPTIVPDPVVDDEDDQYAGYASYDDDDGPTSVASGRR